MDGDGPLDIVSCGMYGFSPLDRMGRVTLWKNEQVHKALAPLSSLSMIGVMLRSGFEAALQLRTASAIEMNHVVWLVGKPS
jgi:hypothetical protein